MKRFKLPMTPPSIGVVTFSPTKTLWLWAMIVVMMSQGFSLITPKLFLISSILALLTLCLGHSVGLHRGVIHRTYETSPFVRGVLTYLFTLSGLGGPLSWARLHAIRDYWQSQSECPEYFAYRHSMLVDFFWNLHLQFRASDDRALTRLPSDVFTNRWLLFLERTWLLHNLAFAVLTYLALGWAGVTVCVCSRIAVGILGHWAIGYSSHVWGEQPHVIDGASEMGTNAWLLGVISFGEGFHNNHHAYPKSARMGHQWYEFDLGWVMLTGLKKAKLVHSVG